MTGSRTRFLALCAVVGCAVGIPATAPAATLPAKLVALEQKMGELKITSLRFSAQTVTVAPPGERNILKLLMFFGANSRTSGEATISPAAASVSLSLFGTRLVVRSVGGTDYLYFPQLGSVDHGRPWVRLGAGGLSEIFTVNGHPPPKDNKPAESTVGEPKLAEPPFAALANTLAGAREVREVGPGTLDGQQVTSFLAVLEPSQLNSKAIASASRRLPAPAPPTVTLEVSLTEGGLPLRTVIVEHAAGLTTTSTLEIPAVDFPLVIEAPPAAQTIDVAALRRLEKRGEARKRHKRRA